MQLQQLGVALSADSFCVAWRKLSSGELVLSFGLKQVLGKKGLQERGGVWGAVEQELGGREEGSLQRQGKLEGDVQLRTTSRESLQPKTCWAALLPKVGNVGELVLGKCVGCGRPRSLGGHGN